MQISPKEALALLLSLPKVQAQTHSLSLQRAPEEVSLHGARAGARAQTERPPHHQCTDTQWWVPEENLRAGFTSLMLWFVVCSTTLWVGQLDKKTQQTDIMLLLEEFGQIESVNVSTSPASISITCSTSSVRCLFTELYYFLQMIPPRGCAYIVMVHRQDASSALNKLSRGSFKVNQKHFKVNSVFPLCSSLCCDLVKLSVVVYRLLGL